MNRIPGVIKSGEIHLRTNAEMSEIFFEGSIVLKVKTSLNTSREFLGEAAGGEVVPILCLGVMNTTGVQCELPLQ